MYYNAPIASTRWSLPHTRREWRAISASLSLLALASHSRKTSLGTASHPPRRTDWRWRGFQTAPPSVTSARRNLGSACRISSSPKAVYMRLSHARIHTMNVPAPDNTFHWTTRHNTSFSSRPIVCCVHFYHSGCSICPLVGFGSVQFDIDCTAKVPLRSVSAARME
jgi:hypothetical protein